MTPEACEKGHDAYNHFGHPVRHRREEVVQQKTMTDML